jgi:hypothetical protein
MEDKEMTLLPTTPTRETADPRRLRILVYGPPGVGKTTFAAGFPEALVLDLEGGARYVECMRIQVDDWSTLRKAWIEITGSDRFATIVIDGVERLRDMAISEFNGGKWPRQIADWGRVNMPISAFLAELLTQRRRGVVMLGHQTVNEVDAVSGERIPLKKEEDSKRATREEIAPSLSGSPWVTVSQYTDIIGHACMDGAGRWLHLAPDGRRVCKSRIPALGERVLLTYDGLAGPLRAAARKPADAPA